MAVQPKCVICGKDLMSNEGYEDLEHKIVKESQTSYWMHDPRNTHVDVQVVSHTVCFDKAKLVKSNFDVPIEDYSTMRYPTSTTTGGTVTLRTLSQYRALNII